MSVSDNSSRSASTKPKPDWRLIREQYETSAISQRELAKVAGVSASTLMKHAMRDKWKQHARTVSLTAAALEAEIDGRVKRRVEDELAPWIEKKKIEFTKRGYGVADRGINRVITMMDANEDPDAKAEAFISKAAETYHRIGRVALGMGDGAAPAGAINLSILTNQAAVQVVTKEA